MKTLFSTINGIVTWLTVATAFAIEPAAFTYTYRTIDEPGLRGINKNGEVLVGPGSPALLDKKLNLTQFRCPVLPDNDNTGAIRLNNRGDVVGWCSIYSRDLNPRIPGLVTFIRDKKGNFTYLSFPDINFRGDVREIVGYGISDDGQVVGYYCVKFAIFRGCKGHGFHWKDGKYTTIDAPVSTDPNDPDGVETYLLGVNRHGQILVEHTESFQNDFSRQKRHVFLYDNGIFTSLDYPSSLSTEGIDLNNDTQVLLFVKLESSSGYFLWDEGKFFPIQLSLPNALSYTIHGMNDDGQLVGSYAMQVGTDPYWGSPILKSYGFIATPARIRKS
jgi:hypothetical protein